MVSVPRQSRGSTETMLSRRSLGSRVVPEAVAEERSRHSLGNQLHLNKSIGQSLAGRTAVLELLPLSLPELSHHYHTSLKKEDLMTDGFLPRLHKDKLPPSVVYSNYFRTCVERDVRLLINLKNLSQFENFLRLLAGRIGQLVNLSSPSWQSF